MAINKSNLVLTKYMFDFKIEQQQKSIKKIQFTKKKRKKLFCILNDVY